MKNEANIIELIDIKKSFTLIKFILEMKSINHIQHISKTFVAF